MKNVNNPIAILRRVLTDEDVRPHGAHSQASRKRDEQIQLSGESYRHSMRHTNQSASAALSEGDAFVANLIVYARKQVNKGNCDEPLKALGEALHPVMDLSSLT